MMLCLCVCVGGGVGVRVCVCVCRQRECIQPIHPPSKVESRSCVCVYVCVCVCGGGGTHHQQPSEVGADGSSARVHKMYNVCLEGLLQAALAPTGTQYRWHHAGCVLCCVVFIANVGSTIYCGFIDQYNSPGGPASFQLVAPCLQTTLDQDSWGPRLLAAS
jgi:hypothetical protein